MKFVQTVVAVAAGLAGLAAVGGCGGSASTRTQTVTSQPSTSVEAAGSSSGGMSSVAVPRGSAFVTLSGVAYSVTSVHCGIPTIPQAKVAADGSRVDFPAKPGMQWCIILGNAADTATYPVQELASLGEVTTSDGHRFSSGAPDSRAAKAYAATMLGSADASLEPGDSTTWSVSYQVTAGATPVVLALATSDAAQESPAILSLPTPTTGLPAQVHTP